MFVFFVFEVAILECFDCVSSGASCALVNLLAEDWQDLLRPSSFALACISEALRIGTLRKTTLGVSQRRVNTSPTTVSSPDHVTEIEATRGRDL